MTDATKTCTRCQSTKPLSDFYPHSAMKDGHLSACKDCTKARVRRHRSENLDRIREYDRGRSNQPHRIAKRREIFENYKAEQPERRKAHVIVGNAIRSGKLIKQPCAFCGATEGLEAHHHDYAAPLDVTWLCKPCHRKFHGLERMATYRDDKAA